MNNFSTFVNDVRKGDECTTIGSQPQVIKTDSMPSSYYKDPIQLLLYKIEVQNTATNELSSQIKEMKVDFKVQNKLTALELASLREKYEHFQHKVEVIEANLPMNVNLKFDQFQCTLNVLYKENDFLKRQIQNISNKINYIESQFKNKTYQINSEMIDSMEVKNDNIHCCDELANSCMITSALLNEEPAIIGTVVNSADQRSDEINKIQQEPTNTIEDNTDHVWTTWTTPNDLESEFHCLGISTDNVTSTEENRDKVFTELTGHSAQVQEQIGTIDNTVNDNKCVSISNPICALNELCMFRNWTLPKYEFFKEDSETFTYSAECTVMTSTVRVGGLKKKEAKRHAATIMYNKLKNVTGINVPLEKNFEQVTAELNGQSESKIVHNQKDIVMVKSATNDLNHSKNVIDIKKLEFNPVCALNELCMSHNWTIPKYEFFKEDSKTFTYSVECTVMTSTVRVGGLKKKEAKRHAATIMYNKLKNVTRSKVCLEKNWEKKIIENKLKDNGILDKACTGLAEEQTIKAIDASVHTLSDDKRVAKVNQVSMLEMSKKVVDHPASLVEHDTDSLIDTTELPNRNENYVSPLNESVDSPNNADLPNRLQLSNNPSVCKLKKLNFIIKNTVPSCFELVNRIAEEEGLKIEYEINTNSTLAIGKKIMTTHLTIRPGTLTFVGYGNTITDCQEEASRKCLIHFKSMLISNISS